MGFKILAINPGSTSTKIALYDDEQPTLALTLRHSAEEIARFPRIIDQLDWRKEMVLEALAKNNFDVKSLSAVIGRGGLIKPIESGVYEVNAALKNDLVNAQREHASNLGVPLATAFAAAPFPGSQTAGFSFFRPRFRLAVPRGFSLLALSWLIAPFCS